MSWWSKLFPKSTRNPLTDTRPELGAMLMAATADIKPLPKIPAPQPELSCFVRGLIRSMKEKPEEWIINQGFQDSWTHVSGIKIWGDYGLRSYPKMTEMRVKQAPSMSQDEREELRRAVEQYLIEPQRQKARQEMLERARQEEAQFSAERAPFEHLGCPDTPSS